MRIFWLVQRLYEQYSHYRAGVHVLLRLQKGCSQSQMFLSQSLQGLPKQRDMKAIGMTMHLENASRKNPKIIQLQYQPKYCPRFVKQTLHQHKVLTAKTFVENLLSLSKCISDWSTDASLPMLDHPDPLGNLSLTSLDSSDVY